MDPLRVWKLLSPNNPLFQLAILVLSFVPNSASTKRLFLTMGNIKTKKRNKLGHNRTRDIAFVKLDLQRHQAEEGTAC